MSQIPPPAGGSRWHRRRWSAAAAAILLLASIGTTSSAAQAAVPPTPPGWSLVWSDDFNGAAGSLPSSANWIIDTGHGYPGGPANWGTGEIAELHQQPVQRQPRRRRQPAHHAAARRRGQLDVGPDRDPAGRLQAAGRRRAAHRGPHPDAQRHRRRRAGLLARVLGARLAVPGQLLELAGHRRVRHHGERQRHQHRLGRAALRGEPGRPVQRDHRPRRNSRAVPRLVVPVGVPHLPRSSGTAASTPTSCAGTSTASSSTASARPSCRPTRGTSMTEPRRLLHPAERGDRRGVPRRARPRRRPRAATVPGRPMLVDYVAVWQPRRRHEPPPPPPPPGPQPPPPPPPGPQPGNLALNRPATGSASCASNEGPSQAVNGSVSGGNSDKFCSSATPKFLQVDLGSNQAIQSFVVKHAQAGGESQSMNTRDFDIQVSGNGTSFTTVVQARGNTSAVSTHSVNTSGRYIRLNIINAEQTGTGGTTRIYEFEAYGSGSPAPPPPPPPPGPPPPPPPTNGDFTQSVTQVDAARRSSRSVPRRRRAWSTCTTWSTAAVSRTSG